MFKNIILALIITITGSVLIYAQNEYYYDFDKHVTVEYSDYFLAIEKNEYLTDWSAFFDDNDYLERLANPFPMPNGMYLMKLKEDAEISSSLDQLSNNIAVNRIIRSWKHDDAQFLFPTDRIVVYFKEELATRLADSIALANGIIEYEKFLGKDNSYLFKVEGDYYKDALNLANVIYESGLANFSMNGFLIQIEPRYMPNDPLYPYQWNLNNTGQGGGTLGADMGMAEAWEYALTPIAENNGGVFEIAYLDDGIADHEDLGWNCFEGLFFQTTHYTTADLPWPQYYHGQSIAGILGGTTDNGIGMSGILKDYDCGPQCNLRFQIICQIIRGPDWGDYPDHPIIYADEISVAQAIYDATHITHHAFALSISYNFALPTYIYNIDTALTGAYNNGVTTFACAGNAEDSDEPGGWLDWPAREPYVIAVGASDYNDQRAGYSYYGYGGVDFLAPSRISTDSGVGVITTDQMGTCCGKIREEGLSCLDTALSADYSCEFGGTSAATPEAAAIALMIFARRRDFRNESGTLHPQKTINIGGTIRPIPEVIREIIRYSCEDVYNNDEVPGVEDTAWINEEYGWGRVNAARAMLAISRGDVNNDAIYNILDIDYLIAYKYKEGPEPVPNRLLGDVDCDGSINVLDIVYLITYKYKDGPRPQLCYKF